MTLLDYAREEIARLGLGDTPSNCHGLVANPAEDGGKAVRISDGVGFDEVCETQAEVDEVLEDFITSAE